MAQGTDPFRDRYSARSASMTGSEIRALFAVLDRPEMVSLAGGNTYTDIVVERVRDCALAALSRAGSGSRTRQDPHDPLQYGAANGLLSLRERLVGLMGLEGIEADPHHIVVTDGAQQGLELLAKVFCDPGDIVLTEAPTYVGALGAFASYQADIRAVAIDDDGIVISELEREILEVAGQGRRAKFLYLVPTFQNPSGVTLAPGRREQVLEVCERHDLLVIEDNPYAQVRFEGEAVTPLRVLAPERVIYLGTLSKVFAPGMRVGWVLAPEPVRDRLVFAKEAANLCSSPFTQMVAEEYLGSGSVEEDLQIVRKVYRERRDAILDALEAHFPPVARTRVPEGGLFIWVTVPGLPDSKAMLGRALEAGVAYLAGTAFYPSGNGGRDAMRLNFSYSAPDVIDEGMRRLGAVVTAELELARSLGG